MAEVSFICKRTVSSTKPVQPGQFSPLSILDQVMERNHLRVVFYYGLQTRRRAGELTKKLRESISDMLCAFPVVTGRLLRTSEGDWTIKCNDVGVRMVEARVEGTIDEWLKNVDREKELKLVYWEEMFHRPYFWSTFYVQITEFEGGGLAIGLSCTHLLSDPTCAAMMIKAWADMTLHAKENSGPVPNTKQTTIMLKFSQEMVKSCIAMARATNAHNCQPSLTPFEALAALFWTRISKIKGMKSALVDMSLCLDVRKVLGLGKGFFGNCMVYKRVQGDGLQENELSKAAGFIKEAVSKTDKDEVMGLIEWLEQENWNKNPSCMNGSCLICADLENVDSYSAVFEENSSLLRVSYYIEPAVGAGQILILPSPGGDGPCSRVVSVTLPEAEAEKLLEDGVIKQFGATIWMGLKLNKNLLDEMLIRSEEVEIQ
ncbi:protein ECERIFERUM 2 [Sesamum alatum]|uniref:Protein ECERIFERUM 2 n=1 Tax=Sesamum alatum TaxID=300844 RepID=A0AAE1XZ00_9LAMI|nr:protein ECERIFERUM 2 [Sesamum alatum]